MAGLTNNQSREAAKLIADFEYAVTALSLNMQAGSPERDVTPAYLLELEPQIQMIADAIQNQTGQGNEA